MLSPVTAIELHVRRVSDRLAELRIDDSEQSVGDADGVCRSALLLLCRVQSTAFKRMRAEDNSERRRGRALHPCSSPKFGRSVKWNTGREGADLAAVLETVPTTAAPADSAPPAAALRSLMSSAAPFGKQTRQRAAERHPGQDLDVQKLPLRVEL